VGYSKDSEFPRSWPKVSPEDRPCWGCAGFEQPRLAELTLSPHTSFWILEPACHVPENKPCWNSCTERRFIKGKHFLYDNGFYKMYAIVLLLQRFSLLSFKIFSKGLCIFCWMILCSLWTYYFST
jgi:hypothetical protein